MRRGRVLAGFSVLALICVMQMSAWPQSSALSAPPAAPVRPVVDDYFGTKVTDPYRYMENLTDPEMRSWIKAQNDYARAVLARIPGRSKMRDRIRELDQSAPASVSDLRHVPGDLYFYQKLPAGADIAKLYMRHGLDGEEKLVCDPDTAKLAPANQSKGKASIQYYVPSPDTRLVIVALTPGGSEDDTELHIIETATGRETGDVILRVTLGDVAYPAWLPDGRSFTHFKFEPPRPGAPVNEHYDKLRAFLHVLGTDPDKDAPVFGQGVLPSQEVPVHGGSYVMIRPARAMPWAWWMPAFIRTTPTTLPMSPRSASQIRAGAGSPISPTTYTTSASTATIFTCSRFTTRPVTRSSAPTPASRTSQRRKPSFPQAKRL